MKTSLTSLVVAAASLCFVARAQSETAYFLMSGPVPAGSQPVFESYVVAVSDDALIQQARDYLRAGDRSVWLVPHVAIAMGVGPDPVNLNYAEPGHPAWSWHVPQLIEWTTFDPSQPRTLAVDPRIDGSPSSVPQLLAADPPYQDMTLIRFPLVMELKTDDAASVVNVSTRGHVGTGEQVLIAGFIVQGGVPRNVLVRGIGPSLAQHGVNEPLADPKITIYRGSEKIAANDDWQDGNFTGRFQIPEEPLPWYTWLFPSDPEEAAFQLSLPPGAYTVHVSGADDATGIALAEVYDLDALKPD